MKPPYAIGSVPSLSGHAIAYRWRSLPRVRQHRASKPQGSSERVLPWQITMDQLIFASLSHTHYWYEVGMLKVPYNTGEKSTVRAMLYTYIYRHVGTPDKTKTKTFLVHNIGGNNSAIDPPYTMIHTFILQLKKPRRQNESAIDLSNARALLVVTKRYEEGQGITTLTRLCMAVAVYIHK